MAIPAIPGGAIPPMILSSVGMRAPQSLADGGSSSSVASVTPGELCPSGGTGSLFEFVAETSPSFGIGYGTDTTEACDKAIADANGQAVPSAVGFAELEGYCGMEGGCLMGDTAHNIFPGSDAEPVSPDSCLCAADDRRHYRVAMHHRRPGSGRLRARRS